ncbi:MAG TPA: magnesium/cobalt transporter CorA [Thermoanaerobaculia bacterium]|nr:magnesium/cobalt transporter CorA [Thermoanaerobaculia bacterium]
MLSSGALVRILSYRDGKVREAQPDELPQLLASGEGAFWVDMTGPDAADLAALRDVFHVHPLAIEDTLNQRQRPKVEEYGGHLFIILNPGSGEGARLHFRELDVFVGERFLVTVHPQPEPVVDAAAQRIERLCGQGPISSAALLYVLVDTVVDTYFPMLDGIGDRIDEIEREILRQPREVELHRLFRLKRGLIEMRKVVAPQRDMFSVLTRRELPYLAQQDLQYHLRDVYDHLLRVTDMLDTYRELLTSSVDLYVSATSNRLNRVVNRLTMLTVVIGSLAVITGFYGMNFERTWPPFAAGWGVPFTIVLMAAAVILAVYIFRSTRWR